MSGLISPDWSRECPATGVLILVHANNEVVSRNALVADRKLQGGDPVTSIREGECDDDWHDLVNYLDPDAFGRLAHLGPQSELGLWTQRRSGAARGGDSGVGAHGAYLTVPSPSPVGGEGLR
jgi:hypothetical protein